MFKLVQYVIYDKPSDFPGKFVVRKWCIDTYPPTPGELLATTDTIEEARQHIPEGSSQLPVYAIDDPVIAEVWM